MAQFQRALEALPAADLFEPRVHIAVVLEEVGELLSAVRQSKTKVKLVSTGLPEERLEVLPVALEGLRLAEAELLKASSPDEHFAEAFQSALSLRQELVLACQWNLRARDVSSALVRISDSTDVMELSLDLRELAQLIEDHEKDFVADRTFDAPVSRSQALALAEELTATPPLAVPAEALQWRDRAFTFLADVVDEVLLAGRYAYRNSSESRSLFGGDPCARRRRTGLNSVVNSLAG